ncbi:hypothetical protein [Agarivorans aestuarii]|uniref:hypothetical protein n=1 Tax=Agarivorans aestuarii TaxID=1563703 RepID=UPI001C7FB258|nr:hypothetical protein [Agarivorans aestuarii]
MKTDIKRQSFEQMQTLRDHHLKYVDFHAEMIHGFTEHLLTMVNSGDLCTEDERDLSTFASHLNEVVHCAMFGGMLPVETGEYLISRLRVELIKAHEEGDIGAFECLEDISEWMEALFGVDFNFYNLH